MLQVSYYGKIFNSISFGLLSVFQFLFILRGLYIAFGLLNYDVSISCTRKINIMYGKFNSYTISILFYLLSVFDFIFYCVL